MRVVGASLYRERAQGLAIVFFCDAFSLSEIVPGQLSARTLSNRSSTPRDLQRNSAFTAPQLVVSVGGGASPSATPDCASPCATAYLTMTVPQPG